MKAKVLFILSGVMFVVAEVFLLEKYDMDLGGALLLVAFGVGIVGFVSFGLLISRQKKEVKDE